MEIDEEISSVGREIEYFLLEQNLCSEDNSLIK